MRNIDELVATSFIDKDMLKAINYKAQIVLYESLYYCNNIDEILEPYGACFLLYQNQPHSSYWCLLFKLIVVEILPDIWVDISF